MTTTQIERTTTKVSLLDRVKDEAADLVAEVAEVEFANHSSHGGDWVTFADMANPDLARNNCWVASSELYENLEIESYLPVEEVDIVGVTCEGNNHFALYLAADGEEVVFDITARQFHPEAPFPLVMPINMWHAYIEHMVGKKMELAIAY